MQVLHVMKKMLLVPKMALFVLTCISSAPLLDSDFAQVKSSGLTALFQHTGVSRHGMTKRHQLSRALRATYYYTCPGEHMQSRDFSWRAIWESEDERISVKPSHNIAFIAPLTIHPPDFFTTWLGTHCTEDEEEVCTYVFTGRTEGSVSPNGIMLALVEHSGNREELPKVSRHCIPRAALEAGTYTCSPVQVAEAIIYCRVDLVNVDVLY